MLLFNLLFVGFISEVNATGTTTLVIDPENTNVTIGDSFIVYINATIDTDDDIGGFEITFFNFTSGVVNITKVNEGDVFDAYPSLFDPGDIYNDTGNVTDSYGAILGVENVSGAKSLVYYNILAYGVGVSPINFSAVLSYSENTFIHTDSFGNITVHPESITGATATNHSHNRINLTWDTPFGNGTDKCVVFANSTGSAASRSPGDEIYNGTSDHYNHTGLDPNQQWNYSFWGWNETARLYSMLFQQDSNTTQTSPGTNTWIILGDATPATGSTYAYKTSQEVNITIIGGYLTDTIQPITHGAFGGASDELPHQYICYMNITFGATQYNETEDYILDRYNGVVDWSPAGDEPAPGASYSANYTYIYNTDSSFKYWINTTAGQKTESSVNSGYKTYTMSGLTGGTEWWNVTAVFDGNKTQGNYSFDINRKPRGGGDGGDWNEDPENSAPSVSVSTALAVDVEDLDGDTVNVTFYWQNDTRIDNDTVAGAGTASVNPSTLDYNTEYGWYVIADDFTDTTRGPTAGYWTFNTSSLGINLTKEWVLNPENNTIRSWINVTNTGTANLTGVNIWDRECHGLNLVSYNNSVDFSGNGHWNWEAAYLNISGYDNHTYKITMLHEYYTLVPLANGSEVWNYANVSHLGQTSGQNVSGYFVGFTATKEANVSKMNSTILDVTWWINITNSGDFNLTNVTVNETYDDFINYTSSNVDPFDESNVTFVIPFIKPSETFSLMVNISATPNSITNGSTVYNNITIRSDQLEEQTFSESLSYGGRTETLRITYDTTLTDVSVYGDSLVIIIGVLLTISALLIVVGLLYKFGYLGRGEQ